MPTKNQALIFSKVPTDFPVPGEHLTIKDIGFDLDQDVPENSLVLETHYVSFDPYLRGLMRDSSVQSYSPAFPIGSPVIARSLSKVLKSSLDGYNEGDIVSHNLPIQEYNLFKRDNDKSPTPVKIDLATAPDDIRHFLGALGMPGLTAYSSLYEIGKPKKGETIFVSSAAGAVGQLVGQLAKHEGLTVLGSVGSDEKLDFITKELGFDGGWNYKKEKGPTKEILDRLTNGKGIDIFYDNVGGEQLQGALDSLNTFGRVVASGQISQYNLSPEQRYPITNTFLTIVKRLTWIGFLVSDENMGPRHAKAFRENVSNWLKDGSFKGKIHETVGIENAAEAFVGMLKGDNFGKAVLKVKK
jgi:NADPH-dependent curcumin reductase CurA